MKGALGALDLQLIPAVIAFKTIQHQVLETSRVSILIWVHGGGYQGLRVKRLCLLSTVLYSSM